MNFKDIIRKTRILYANRALVRVKVIEQIT